jgi:tRNA-uridine 2-sulfurtransferase
MFSRRLRELMERNEDRQIRDYELLKYGRHFRTETGEKIIVGRNKADNDAMLRLTADNDRILHMVGHPGPCVLIPDGSESAVPFAAALCVRYSDAPDGGEELVCCEFLGRETIIRSRAASKENCEKWMI